MDGPTYNTNMCTAETSFRHIQYAKAILSLFSSDQATTIMETTQVQKKGVLYTSFFGFSCTASVAEAEVK